MENPTTVTEEMQVVKEAQDNTRTHEELKALREIAVFWQQKKRANLSHPAEIVYSVGLA